MTDEPWPAAPLTDPPIIKGPRKRASLPALIGGWLFVIAFAFELIQGTLFPPPHNPHLVEDPGPLYIDAVFVALCLLGLAVARGVRWAPIPAAAIAIALGAGVLRTLLLGDYDLSGPAVWSFPAFGVLLLLSGGLCLLSIVIALVRARDTRAR